MKMNLIKYTGFLFVLLAVLLTVSPATAIRPSALHHVIRNPGSIISVAFSPDGRMLVCGGENTLRLFDVKSGFLLRSLSDPEAVVNSVSFSPDGRLLASAGDDGIIKIWDVDSGKEKRSIVAHIPHETPNTHDYRIFSVRFSPDGAMLASGSGGFECIDCMPYGEVKMWDVETGKLKATFSPLKDYAWSLAFSPDGNLLASASARGKVRIWDLESREVIAELDGHKDDVLSLVFSSAGDCLVTGSRDKTIKTWDTASWKVKRTFRDHKDEVLSVAFFAGRRIASLGGGDKKIRLWDVSNGAVGSIRVSYHAFLNSIAISPDGKIMAIGIADGTLVIREF